jgi:uncharacterized protein DUF4365
MPQLHLTRYVHIPEEDAVGTKYPSSGQTGDEGVAIVRRIVAKAGGVCSAFESPDLGVEGTIELLTEDRGPSGDLVLPQIKCRPSSIRRGHCYVDADRAHFETWARYAVRVVASFATQTGPST